MIKSTFYSSPEGPFELSLCDFTLTSQLLGEKHAMWLGLNHVHNVSSVLSDH